MLIYILYKTPSSTLYVRYIIIQYNPFKLSHELQQYRKFANLSSFEIDSVKIDNHKSCDRDGTLYGIKAHATHQPISILRNCGKRALTCGDDDI